MIGHVGWSMADDEEGADGTAQQIARLHDIANRIQAELAVHESASRNRMSSDTRDTANLMLAQRAGELALAAADDFHFNRPVAGAIVGRAILETAITLRWCLRSESNAKRWWEGGDTAIVKAVRALGISTDPKVIALRDAKHIGTGLPGLPTMAKEADLIGPYTRWYHILSAYAHPTRMATAHAYGPPGRATPAPLVPPCIYFSNDVGTVFSGWATQREIAPPWPHP